MTDRLKRKALTIRDEQFEIREMKGTERFKSLDLQDKEGNVGVAGFILTRCVVKPDKFKFDDYPSATCEKLFNEVAKLSEVNADQIEDAAKK